jgi:hypothetical protein
VSLQAEIPQPLDALIDYRRVRAFCVPRQMEPFLEKLFPYSAALSTRAKPIPRPPCAWSHSGAPLSIHAAIEAIWSGVNGVPPAGI